MAYEYLDIAATPGVRAAQEANGSGKSGQFPWGRASDRFTEAEERRSPSATASDGDRVGERLALCAAPRRAARLHPHS